MATPLKAVLLSGLVYPGLGQLSLKQRRKGAIIIVVVSLSLLYFIIQIVTQVQQSLLESGIQNSVTDPVAVSVAVDASIRNSVPTGGDSSGQISGTLLSLVVMVAGWFYSVIDAYLIGKRQRENE